MLLVVVRVYLAVRAPKRVFVPVHCTFRTNPDFVFVASMCFNRQASCPAIVFFFRFCNTRASVLILIFATHYATIAEFIDRSQLASASWIFFCSVGAYMGKLMKCCGQFFIVSCALLICHESGKEASAKSNCTKWFLTIKIFVFSRKLKVHTMYVPVTDVFFGDSLNGTLSMHYPYEICTVFANSHINFFLYSIHCKYG